ncbi:MAG: nitroreductase family protein [archaeon]|nr:nitroreductase family protein [archaeon]MCR4323666.1 nitroreductase family protein [Nanoarchaeota archaeon]
MDLKTAIKERRSIRKYHHKKPDWRKIIKAIDAARFAPSAGNQFVTKFVLVSDTKKISEIAAACQQSFISKAPYVVVVVSDESKLIRSYGDRGVRYTSTQAGAAIENFLLAATELGLASVWVGHFVEDQVKRALQIPDELTIDAVLPVGLETATKTSPRKKIDLENILYFEKWKNKLMSPQTKLGADAS